MRFSVRPTGKGAGVLAGMVLISISALVQAGEPIRFVRPKEDKAPLRHNFSAEKLQSKESFDSSVFAPDQPTSGGGGGGPVPMNRKARAAALARKNWATSEADPKGAPPVNPAATRRLLEETASASEQPRGPANGPGLGNDGLTPRSPAQPGALDRGPGFGSDNRAALRNFMSPPANPGDSSGLGPRGDAFGGMNPRGPANAPLGAETVRPPVRSDTAGTLQPEGASGPSRPVDIGLPPSAPSRPEHPFDPADRPLRSTFDVPKRPR